MTRRMFSPASSDDPFSTRCNTFSAPWYHLWMQKNISCVHCTLREMHINATFGVGVSPRVDQPAYAAGKGLYIGVSAYRCLQFPDVYHRPAITIWYYCANHLLTPAKQTAMNALGWIVLVAAMLFTSFIGSATADVSGTAQRKLSGITITDCGGTVRARGPSLVVFRL